MSRVEGAPTVAATVPTRSLPPAYWRQWTASAISNLGDGISFVALPLLALSVTSDERLLALVTFATFVPWLVIALPVGVVVDRADRQRLMVAANVVRVVLFAAVALLAATDRASIWSLLALLLVIGGCEVVFDSSAQAFLPSLVAPDLLPRANGLLIAAEVVAGSIAGLSIGALLFDASVGLPFGIDALSFAAAGGLIASIRAPRPSHRAAGDDTGGAASDDGMRAGLVWLWEHPMLRTLALMFAVTNLGLMFGQGIFVKYAIVELDLSNAEYGILLAVTAIGGATGGLVGHRVIVRIGQRAAVVAAYLVFGVAQVVIGLAPPAWLVAAAGFVLAAAITVWNVVTVTLRQRIIPPDRFGRVNSVYRWLGAAASAAGVVAGGMLAFATDLRAPFLAGGAITLVAAACFAGPVLTALAGED